MGRAAQRLDQVVPLRAIRRSLKDTATRAEDGDATAQAILLNVAATFPSLLGIAPENVGLKLSSHDFPTNGANPLIPAPLEEAE